MADHSDNILDKLIRSTRSPRGKYSAARSWRMLERRLFPDSCTVGRHRIWLTFMRTAAIFVILLAGWLTYRSLQPAAWQTVSTLAETRTVILPDRSEVILNRYSSLSYPEDFKGNDRPVKLTGEACFQVTKDREHPFIVQAGLINVQVLGTRFNVDAYPDNEMIRTTLLEGSVAVSVSGKDKKTVLKPNESAVYNPITGHIIIMDEPDAEDNIAWSKGRLVFRQETLEEITRKLSHAYHVSIQITDKNLAHYRMTATFNVDEELERILDLLKETCKFEYTRDKNIIKITRHN